MEGQLEFTEPTQLADVATFKRWFRLPFLVRPGIPSQRRGRLVCDLMREELCGLRNAVENDDVVEVAEALAALQVPSEHSRPAAPRTSMEFEHFAVSARSVRAPTPCTNLGWGRGGRSSWASGIDQTCRGARLHRAQAQSGRWPIISAPRVSVGKSRRSMAALWCIGQMTERSSGV